MKELTLEELENIVKTSPNKKSPGLDGLPYELYKSLWDIIGRDFLQVVKDQMSSFHLIESGRHGATVVPPKVKGVPDVTELRPSLFYAVTTGSCPRLSTPGSTL